MAGLRASALKATDRSREIRLRDVRQWDVATWLNLSARLIILISGLFFFAFAVVLTLQSNLGANSWTVLSDGISRQTPITIGQATQITGLIMLLVSWAVGIAPGIGTVLNMVLVGFFVDFILGTGLIDKAGPYPLRILMLVAAVVVIGLASGMYISSGLGAGPRDSFMLALTEITGLPVHVNRWMIEVVVVIIGIILGGDFGIGTIIFALVVGPAVGIGFRIFGLSTRSGNTAIPRSRRRMRRDVGD